MIPKSQYIVRYTNGSEYEIVQTREEYIGYYISTFNNEYYAGTNGFDLGLSLRPILPELSAKNSDPSINVQIYNLLKEGQLNWLNYTQPIPAMKRLPSQRDYNYGYMYRYFVKRFNDANSYKEVDKETYLGIINKDTKYDFNLYKAGYIVWYLKGNVHKKNAQEINKAKNKHKHIAYLFPKLDEYFLKDTSFLEENLYTEGGELYTSDGEEYIGDYHLHPSQGPMIGAVHTDNPHQKLYYLNQLPSPPNTTYEEWIQSQSPQNNPATILPTRDGVTESQKSYNCVVNWVKPDSGYTGLTNTQGLVPGGAACIDPGNGTGMYTHNEYGNSALYECQNNCSISGNVNPDISMGCLYPFDPNYCSECNSHHDDACALTYYNYQVEGTCLCGNYNTNNLYATPCCFENPDSSNGGGPQDFDPTNIPGVGPSY